MHFFFFFCFIQIASYKLFLEVFRFCLWSCNLHLLSLSDKEYSAGADPGFEKGGFNVVPKSDTGGATHNHLWKHHQESTQES